MTSVHSPTSKIKDSLCYFFFVFFILIPNINDSDICIELKHFWTHFFKSRSHDEWYKVIFACAQLSIVAQTNRREVSHPPPFPSHLQTGDATTTLQLHWTADQVQVSGCCAVLYCNVLYCTVYCTVLYCIVLYCTVLTTFAIKLQFLLNSWESKLLALSNYNRSVTCNQMSRAQQLMQWLNYQLFLLKQIFSEGHDNLVQVSTKHLLHTRISGHWRELFARMWSCFTGHPPKKLEFWIPPKWTPLKP